MTHDEMTAVVHAYIESFNNGDAQAALALYAPDAQVEDPVGTPVKTGSAAILEFYQHSMATGAKLTLEGPVLRNRQWKDYWREGPRSSAAAAAALGGRRQWLSQRKVRPCS